MSGPNPPGPESEESDSGDEPRREPSSGDELTPSDDVDAGDDLAAFDDDSAAHDHVDQTGQTDAYSRAYSAPESEHFMSGPYVPADLRLYDYDDYDEASDADEGHRAP